MLCRKTLQPGEKVLAAGSEPAWRDVRQPIVTERASWWPVREQNSAFHRQRNPPLPFFQQAAWFWLQLPMCLKTARVARERMSLETDEV